MVLAAWCLQAFEALIAATGISTPTAENIKLLQNTLVITCSLMLARIHVCMRCG